MINNKSLLALMDFLHTKLEIMAIGNLFWKIRATSLGTTHLFTLTCVLKQFFKYKENIRFILYIYSATYILELKSVCLDIKFLFLAQIMKSCVLFALLNR